MASGIGQTVDQSPAWEATLSSLRKHIVLDYGDLKVLCDGLRITGQRIGATIGTFDMMHVGHARYLMAARSYCDVLVVGADSDNVVKAYKKDENRPVVPEGERLEMLLHQRGVDYATLITDVTHEGAWEYGFLDAVRPDVFITSIGSYPAEQLDDIKGRCLEVVELERQAETSTSEKMRQLMLIPGKSVAEQLRMLAVRVERGDINV